ncbi:MAG: thioredoxin domain-containing protein [Patescibacteria group bacterium]
MVKLPKFTNLLDRLIPVLLVATIGLAFLVGVLWQKVQNLEGGKTVTGTGTGNQQAAAPTGPKLAPDDLKKFAKDLGLDTNKFNSCLDNGKYEKKVSGDLAYGGTLGITGTPGFFLNGRMITGAQPYAVFKEAIDFELKGGNWDNAPASIAAQVSKTKTNVNIGDSSSKGDSNAKVVLVEFSDFQCPFCARFYSETLGQIQKDYIDTGKVRLVYKHFPLISIHPNAQKAGEASECANEQGKFWEMHDALFESHGF